MIVVDDVELDGPGLGEVRVEVAWCGVCHSDVSQVDGVHPALTPSVLGHEAGPLPPYEELFRSGRGFTDPEEARRFVAETGVDWLSVAVGNIHGAISGAAKSEKKVEARLNIGHLDRIRAAVGGDVPLVLHGGSGIAKASILEGVRHGIAKINIGTAIRQAYESGAAVSPAEARRRTKDAVLATIRDELGMAGSADKLLKSVQ